MSTAPSTIFRRAHFALHPSKARRIQVNYRNSKCVAAALCPDFLLYEKQCLCCCIITTECSHTGLVPDSPTFFNSSPFKALSPQPPKFLKSLLPVKEENKAKKALEARPLLGQEVRRKKLYFQEGSIHVFVLPYCSLSQFPHILVLSVLCRTPFLHFTMSLVISNYIYTIW